jgi:hypothetical protein
MPAKIVDRIAVMPNGSSMPWPARHAADLAATPHCWTSQQWHPRAQRE